MLLCGFKAKAWGLDSKMSVALNSCWLLDMPTAVGQWLAVHVFEVGLSVGRRFTLLYLYTQVVYTAA